MIGLLIAVIGLLISSIANWFGIELNQREIEKLKTRLDKLEKKS